MASEMGGHRARRQLWQRAVELGGMGHTAAAMAVLDAIGRAGESDNDVIGSLAYSTAASLLRQAGDHRAAVGRDGRALYLAGPTIADDSPWQRAATLDALVGLAADDLGLLRFGAAARLLARARVIAETAADDDWLGGRRPRLRIEWVCAELAMYTDRATDARTHAERAMRIAAADDVPERHRVKTSLIAAAAASAAGDPRRAGRLAIEVTGRAHAAGLLPLEWASWALRAGLDADEPEVATQFARTRAELLRRGVPFADGRT